VKELKESLLQEHSAREIRSILAPFLTLADDRDFWNHTLDGLAVLGAKGLFRAYKLQRPVAELAVVADSFHTKPLLRILQSADRYHVLGLSLSEIKLFEGNRDSLDQIELAPGVPRTIVEALGDQLTDPYHTSGSYGGSGPRSSMHHGHGSKETEVDIDAERYFRAVDRGILEHHSRPSALPLILATLPQHRELFHRVSHNPHLIDEGINIHPDALPIDELRQRTWRVVEPRYLARLAVMVEEFGRARSNDLGHEEPEQVAKAVVAGRVATLLIEADRELPGRVNTETGDVEFDVLAHPKVDDVLDDLAALALKMGGQVVIVPTERMPTQTGIAAIYRY